MSCLKLCDSEDCYNSENESQIYHIDYETSEFLKKYCRSWFNGYFDDICQDCIDNINDDYPDFYIYDDYNLEINKKYLNNPELVL